MIDKWRIIFVVGIIASWAVMGLLFQLNHSDQISLSAFALSCSLIMLSLPYQAMRQKTLSNLAKIWCLLAGPFWLCAMLILRWLLGNISRIGSIAAEIVHILFPIALFFNLFLLLRKPMMAPMDRADSDCYDRHQAIRRGENYSRAGQHQKAIDEYTIGIDRDPNDAEMYYLRAQSYEKLGDNELGRLDRKTALVLGYQPELKMT